METKIIKIADLLINPNNYRFESQSSQRDAIIKMIDDQKDKLYRLAKDILEHGLNPMEKPLIIPQKNDKGEYLVLEGNRRITALKLLSNPDLIPDKDVSLKKRFKKLNVNNSQKIVRSVECSICNNAEEADIWIQRKHATGLDGIGVESWTPQQKQRFEEKTQGKTSDSLQILHLLRNSDLVEEKFKSKLAQLKITNLQRLISDPYVREKLGIQKEEGKLCSTVNQADVVNELMSIINDLLSQKFAVSQIYNKENRKHYIDTKFNGSFPADKGSNGQKWNFSDNSQRQDKDNDSTNEPQLNTSSRRRTLISKGSDIVITNNRISKIYAELKKLPVQSYPNTVSVMVRVFIELSVDVYIEKFGLLKNGSLTACSSKQNLESKVLVVINRLERKKEISADLTKGIRNELKDKSSILSIESMNAYVHNFRFSPKPDNLFLGWDNVQPFLEVLWKVIGETNE
jgi:hypothetical protein